MVDDWWLTALVSGLFPFLSPSMLKLEAPLPLTRRPSSPVKLSSIFANVVEKDLDDGASCHADANTYLPVHQITSSQRSRSFVSSSRPRKPLGPAKVLDGQLTCIPSQPEVTLCSHPRVDFTTTQ
ncbi:hypothetical protein PG985_007873 [Apiospora marii]|uniref:Uncharacterized protein n=1 Tax=Apiospora marii TaxID=335849 RepID=A0ABR1SPV6_9PEZI